MQCSTLSGHWTVLRCSYACESSVSLWFKEKCSRLIARERITAFQACPQCCDPIRLRVLANGSTTAFLDHVQSEMRREHVRPADLDQQLLRLRVAVRIDRLPDLRPRRIRRPKQLNLPEQFLGGVDRLTLLLRCERQPS